MKIKSDGTVMQGRGSEAKKKEMDEERIRAFMARIQKLRDEGKHKEAEALMKRGLGKVLTAEGEEKSHYSASNRARAMTFRGRRK